jgi:glyoxylase-like metal-dependent hydrolase (beta-lactamase superfamily II)
VIEEILPNLYKIEVPLPNNPLGAINSYVLRSGERSLVIDTGMNQEECRRVLSAGLKKLSVDLRQTDYLITHWHADHLAGVVNLATDASAIYLSDVEASVITSGTYGPWERFPDFLRLNGFPESELQTVVKVYSSPRYRPTKALDIHPLTDGDSIVIGDYSFKCIETPGHSPGHMCLYEPGKRIFVSGDHILPKITPIVSLMSYEDNPLGEYLESLDKVYSLDVVLVLPAHGNVFNRFKERIQELKKHHEMRADEVLRILRRDEQDAFEVASQMTWDVKYASWQKFPPNQRWFACGEAMAHLKYLEQKGKVQMKLRNRKVVFSLGQGGIE